MDEYKCHDTGFMLFFFSVTLRMRKKKGASLLPNRRTSSNVLVQKGQITVVCKEAFICS
uniref:Uncharacterized protein n=1 Tax=Oryza brachyantha TaxID=4533 RepID=J3M4R9_ORYBR